MKALLFLVLASSPGKVWGSFRPAFGFVSYQRSSSAVFLSKPREHIYFVPDPGVPEPVLTAAMEHAINVGKQLKESKAAEEHLRVVERACEHLDQLKQAGVVASPPDELETLSSATEKGATELAYILLEKAIAASADKLLETEERVHAAIDAVKDSMEDAIMAESMKTMAMLEMKASSEHAAELEEFDGSYEADERRRDLAVSHAAHHVLDDSRRLELEAKQATNRALKEEHNAEDSLDTIKRNKAELENDLHELHKIIMEQATAEWKEKQKLKQ